MKAVGDSSPVPIERVRILISELFALIAQHNVISLLHLVSPIILSIDLAIVWLFLSTTPLLQGVSAGVVLSVMFRLSQIVMNSELANSPPLSDMYFVGDP